MAVRAADACAPCLAAEKVGRDSAGRDAELAEYVEHRREADAYGLMLNDH